MGKQFSDSGIRQQSSVSSVGVLEMSWSRNCPHWVVMWDTRAEFTDTSGWKVRLTSLAEGRVTEIAGTSWLSPPS